MNKHIGQNNRVALKSRLYKMSIEFAAGSILHRGISLDTSKRYTEAMVCYQEGMQLLIDKMKEECDPQRKAALAGKIDGYMKRAEHIKRLIANQKEVGNFHEEIHISENSTGHSYRSLFGRFLDNDVTFVKIEDAYIRSYYQCQNLVRLCELLVKLCKNLKSIILTTSSDRDKLTKDQSVWFAQLRENLLTYAVQLEVNFSATLHDRQIMLSNGWIIKIGRGLDIYKPPLDKFSLGVYDLEFRQCHQTTVDIFHSKDVKYKFL